MTESDYLEFKFIRNELQRFGMELREVMVKTIEAKDLIKYARYAKDEVEAHLKDRIGYKVTSNGEKGGAVRFTFADYGRFIDLRFRKIKNRAKMNNRTTVTETLHGIKSRSKGKKNKDTQWYNSTVFGRLYHLIGRLSYGYTEAVRLDLKKHLSIQYNG